jgi:hypothetical protein
MVQLFLHTRANFTAEQVGWMQVTGATSLAPVVMPVTVMMVRGASPSQVVSKKNPSSVVKALSMPLPLAGHLVQE